MKHNKRVYGAIGVKQLMGNFNADFTGRPRRTSWSEFFASSTSLGYPMKRLWDAQGKTVFNLRSYREEEKDKAIVPRDIKERFEQLFKVDLTSKTKIPDQVVLQHLFSSVDVMNFGAAFAVAGYNFQITGATQIYEGFNKYEATREEEMTMTTQFRNAKGEEKEKDGKEEKEDKEGKEKEAKRQTTLGSKTVLDEAHFYFSFSINPDNYKEYEEVLEGFEGYSEEAYESFRDAALCSVTNLTSKSKAGAENEFALFVTCKEGERVIMPALAPYISFSKEGNRDVVNIEEVLFLLQDFEKEIEQVEVFYNPYRIDIQSGEASFKEKVMYKNIFTQELISS